MDVPFRKFDSTRKKILTSAKPAEQLLEDALGSLRAACFKLKCAEKAPICCRDKYQAVVSEILAEVDRLRIDDQEASA